ncbi:NAD-binding Rossmann fold oxidoreductase family protein [Xylariaceae sp. FL1651]|nr:NAD-binding Rossmann fold oxidoreductase family protein [Xylariaceae sp. FL1651]
MAPIRVGFIGLSSSGWARGAHLPYLQNGGKYEIVAICNSSAKSAQDAIALYNLPSSVKAYGDPEELAKDPNVELVVCSVRVDKHLPTIAPSLKAGKNVFVEWPLGKNLAEAKELLRLKNEAGVKTADVGLQARQDPVIATIKQLVDSGKIGKVLNSTWTGQGENGGQTVNEGYEYLSQREYGGNLVTIHFGHFIDYVQHGQSSFPLLLSTSLFCTEDEFNLITVLGYGFSPAPKSLLANRRKYQKLLDKDGKVINEKFEATFEDTIFLHGTLSTGVPLSFSLRGGKHFKDSPGLDWRIYGETGEIRVTSPQAFLQIGHPDTKVQVYDFEKDEIEEVEVKKDEFDEGDKYGQPAKNVGRLYKGLAEGQVNCSFEDAVLRHELIDAMYKENGIQGC